MQSAGIIGVGLIGGSFGLALRKAGFKGAILGVSSARSIEEAVGRVDLLDTDMAVAHWKAAGLDLSYEKHDAASNGQHTNQRNTKRR